MSITVAGPALAGKSELAFTPAVARPPRFIVQHTTPGRHQLVDVLASSTAKEVVGDYTSFESARAEQHRRNAEYWESLEIGERLRADLARHARIAALADFLVLADTEERLALIARARTGGAAYLHELVDEFDRDYTEAAAGL